MKMEEKVWDGLQWVFMALWYFLMLVLSVVGFLCALLQSTSPPNFLTIMFLSYFFSLALIFSAFFITATRRCDIWRLSHGVKKKVC